MTPAERTAQYRRQHPFLTLTLAEKRKRLSYLKPEWDYSPATGELTSQRHVGRPIVLTTWRGVHFNRAAICVFLHTGFYPDPLAITFIDGNRYNLKYENIVVLGQQK